MNFNNCVILCISSAEVTSLKVVMEGKPVAPGKTDIAIDEMAMVNSLKCHPIVTEELIGLVIFIHHRCIQSFFGIILLLLISFERRELALQFWDKIWIFPALTSYLNPFGDVTTQCTITTDEKIHWFIIELIKIVHSSIKYMH